MGGFAKAIGSIVGAAIGGPVGFSLSGFLFSIASSLVLSAISRALTPEPKKAPRVSFGRTVSGITQTLREPLVSRKVIYGQTRVGGALVFAAGTSDNKYLHMVVALAGHEVESIDEVWLNDYAIPNDWLDGSGVVNQGRYLNKVRILKYLGSDSQTASTQLVSEVGEWTTDHRLRGVAYVYVRLEYDQDKFPGGIPNISAFVKGKKITDSRTGSSVFTTNAALFQYDYLANSDYGLNAAADIDEATADASYNLADEIVTTADKTFTVSSVAASTDILTLSGDILELYLGEQVHIASSGSLPSGLSAATNYYVIPYQFKDTPRIKLAASLADAMAGASIDLTTAGSGTITITKKGEPRYHGGGIIDTENTIEQNIQDLLSATAGRVIYAGGKWLIKAAAYETPTTTLTADDFISTVKVQTATPRRERFNAIKGVYRTPLNFDVPSDWPSLASTAFATVDNGETIWREYDTPFTQRPQTARRIAKIELLRARQEIIITATVNLRGLKLQCGSTVMVTLADYGFSAKIFEVTNFALTSIESSSGGAPAYGVSLVLRETDSTAYDWATSEEQDVDPAPNTTLPSPFDVAAVSGVSFDSRPIETIGGDVWFMMALMWDAHPDSFVSGNGRFEIQYKKTIDTTYRPSFFVNGDLTFSDIFSATPGDLHDVRIRAVNNLGVRSEWVTLLGLSPGSGGGVTESADWGDFIISHSSAEDWGDFITSHSSAEDWGGFV